MYDALSLIAHTLARWVALAGGALLLGIVGLTCLSIIGRALLPFGIGPGPIRGIYDLTEIGMAAAVFAFLPWCQLQRGHLSVDMLKPVFPETMNRVLDLVFDAAMLSVALVGTHRLFLGLLDKIGNGETTQIAQIPVWYGYGASLLGAGAFVLVAAFCVIRAARGLRGPAQDDRHV